MQWNKTAELCFHSEVLVNVLMSFLWKMQRVAMGKEKKIFQAWKKPSRVGNAASEGNFVEDTTATLGKQHRNSRKAPTSKPKGMKKSVAMNSIRREVLDLKADSELRNKTGDASPEEPPATPYEKVPQTIFEGNSNASGGKK